MDQSLTELFCEIDDFCMTYLDKLHSSALPATSDDRQALSRCVMALSEIMTIVVWFHLSGFRTFKKFYVYVICRAFASYFPHRLSYNRFVELMPSLFAPLVLYLNRERIGKCTGISFIDSTTLDVCDPHRIHSNRVFKGIAQRGKSSTGWFYGFKLHLVINDQGEIISCALTPGNVDDRDPETIRHLCKGLYGKLYGDRGYLSQKLFAELYKKGITLVTKLKRNMKNKLMDLQDKLLLRKRALIESVNDFLKNICQIEHSRHRSPGNFVINILSGLVAYSFLPKKPSLHISCDEDAFCSLCLIG
jgi:hypothetical protein